MPLVASLDRSGWRRKWSACWFGGEERIRQNRPSSSSKHFSVFPSLTSVFPNPLLAVIWIWIILFLSRHLIHIERSWIWQFVSESFESWLQAAQSLRDHDGTWSQGPDHRASQGVAGPEHQAGPHQLWHRHHQRLLDDLKLVISDLALWKPKVDLATRTGNSSPVVMMVTGNPVATWICVLGDRWWDLHPSQPRPRVRLQCQPPISLILTASRPPPSWSARDLERSEFSPTVLYRCILDVCNISLRNTFLRWAVTVKKENTISCTFVMNNICARNTWFCLFCEGDFVIFMQLM